MGSTKWQRLFYGVNVTIDPLYTGDIVFDWMIAGDSYGSEPHFVYGITSVSPPFIEIFNIYRDGELLKPTGQVPFMWMSHCHLLVEAKMYSATP